MGCTSKVALPVLESATTLLASLFAGLLHIMRYTVGLLVSLMQKRVCILQQGAQFCVSGCWCCGCACMGDDMLHILSPPAAWLTEACTGGFWCRMQYIWKVLVVAVFHMSHAAPVATHPVVQCMLSILGNNSTQWVAAYAGWKVLSSSDVVRTEECVDKHSVMR
jgi:hypothetical protein